MALYVRSNSDTRIGKSDNIPSVPLPAKYDWKKAGGFESQPELERPEALKIEIRRVTFYLKIFAVLTALLIVEYVLCGVYFRLVRHADFWKMDLACALCALGLCYWISKKPLRAALKERIPVWAVAAFFLAFWFLSCCFLRYSAQLVNGLLDFSDPETRVVYVTGRKISPFGGSIREGLNPAAHLIYFQDWDEGGGTCELLAPPALYYFADPGTPVGITFRHGFFGLPWVVDFQLLQHR
jgi:hypothetical protein